MTNKLAARLGKDIRQDVLLLRPTKQLQKESGCRVMVPSDSGCDAGQRASSLVYRVPPLLHQRRKTVERVELCADRCPFRGAFSRLHQQRLASERRRGRTAGRRPQPPGLPAAHRRGSAAAGAALRLQPHHGFAQRRHDRRRFGRRERVAARGGLGRRVVVCFVPQCRPAVDGRAAAVPPRNQTADRRTGDVAGEVGGRRARQFEPHQRATHHMGRRRRASGRWVCGQ